MRGLNLLLVLAVGVLFLQFVSSVTELPGYVDIYVNSSGERWGFKYLWTQNYSGNYDEFGGIVIENDIGYTVSKNATGNITAFNATTGALIWTTYIGESDGTPLLDGAGDYIYINPGYSGPISAVYKINKTSGALLLNNTACTHNMGSLTQSDDLVFQGCMDGKVYAYNKNDLSINWTYNNSNFTYISMTPLYYQGTLLIGGTVGEAGVLTNDAMNNTISLNASTGEVRWSSNFTYVQFWDTQPSAENGVVFLGGSAGYSLTSPTGWLFAFNNTNGVPLWNITIGTYSQVALWEDLAVVTNKGTSGSAAVVFVVNKTTGQQICNKSFGARIYQGLSVVNGIGFFGQAQYGSNFSAINLTNCDYLYKNEFPASIYNPPAIARGKLFVKDDSKRLYSFDLGNGTGDWKYLGYDSTGRSSCTDCVTDLKYVKSNCTGNDSVYNCTLKNYYSETIYANLINSTGYNYTVSMLAGETKLIAYNSSGFSNVDISVPTIYLYSIDDSTSTSRNFIFNVSDESDLANCTLYLNSLTASNSSAVNKSSNNTISYSGLDSGSYSTYVNCTDVFGFVGKSNVVSFEVLAEEEEVSSGGYSGPISKTISDSMLSNGFTGSLRKSDSFRFKIGGELYNLTLINMSNNSITIQVRSAPQVFNMVLGENLNVDVNSDGVYDLKVIYVKYFTSLVTLKLEKISLPYVIPTPVKNNTVNESPYGIGEPTSSSNLIETKSELNYRLEFILIIVVASVILFFLIRRLYKTRREKRVIRSIHYTSRFS